MAEAGTSVYGVRSSLYGRQDSNDIQGELKCLMPSQSNVALEQVPENVPPKQHGTEIPGAMPPESDTAAEVSAEIHGSENTKATPTTCATPSRNVSGVVSPDANMKGAIPASRVEWPPVQPVVHAAVVASLALCEALYGASCGRNADIGEEQILLAVCFASLLALLLAAQTLALWRRVAISPPRLPVAFLHAGVSLGAAFHRRALSECSKPQEHGMSGLALILGGLQLVSALLYPTSRAAGLVASAVSVAALALFQVVIQEAGLHYEYYVLLLSLAAVSVWSASSQGRPLLQELLLLRPEEPEPSPAGGALVAQERRDALDGETQEMQEAFRPIFALKEKAGGDDASPQVGTYLSHIISTIAATAQKVAQVSCLEEPVRQLLVDALGIIQGELGSTSNLQRIPDAALAKSSTAIVDYVNKMLHPSASDSQAPSSSHSVRPNKVTRFRSPVDNSSSSAVSGVLEATRLRASFDHSSSPALSAVTVVRSPSFPQRALSPKTTMDTLGSSATLTAQARNGIYNEIIRDMAAVLHPPPQPQNDEAILRTPSPNINQLLVTAGLELGSWHLNLFDIFEQPEKQPIPIFGGQAVAPHSDKLGVSWGKVASFLEAIEERYIADTPYHNSLHGADVLNSLVYFMRLPSEAMKSLDELEKFTGLLVAVSHDVGHTGKANRYHTVVQTPLARLFNDQSVLENMHCSIMFAVLRMDACNVLEALDSPSQTAFRSLAIQMILNTDLAKHVKAVSQFRQEFIDGNQPAHAKGEGSELSPPQRRELLSFLLKCADVGGSAKPFRLHAQWTMRICSEFYAQGDAESALGLSCSPFCDRGKTSLRECQSGFFDFVAAPMFGALGDYFTSPRIKFEVLAQMEQNRGFWKKFDDKGVDHNTPMMNVPKLQFAFLQMTQPGGKNSTSHDGLTTGEPSKPLPGRGGGGGRLGKNMFISDPCGNSGARLS